MQSGARSSHHLISTSLAKQALAKASIGYPRRRRSVERLNFALKSQAGEQAAGYDQVENDLMTVDTEERYQDQWAFDRSSTIKNWKYSFPIHT